ncbi:MAG: hypothetical protein WA211_19070 [Candidatus Acidiferrales bacterium]
MKRADFLQLTISLLACSALLAAQNSPKTTSMRPPPILNVFREYVKAGNTEITESYNAIEQEAVRTCVRLHCPNSYFAAESHEPDGRPAWWFSMFDSPAEVDRAAGIYAQNAELHAAMARILESKKDLVWSPENTLAKYRADLSRDSGVDFPHAIWLTVTVIKVRDGRLAEFAELQKQINRAAAERGSERAGTRPSGLVYQGMAAADAQTFFIILPQRNLPKRQRDGAASGADPSEAAAAAAIERLAAEAITSSATTSPAIRPDFSCVSREWIAADPDFWAPAGIYIPLDAR